ncbi:MAG: MFS transporter [Dehalococcoidia bacterium]|nr:MFS transporter [Dehalococcoidia bacterium]
MAISFAASTTGQIFMAIMLKPMTEELGWSRSETAGAIFFGTLCGGLMAPATGMLADRFGARLLTPVGAAVVGVALLWQGGTVTLWQFYAAYAIARAVASNFLSGVAPLTTAANWFYRMRGRAMGLMSMAFPLGGSALTIAGQVLMEQAGWRAVFTTFGVLLLVVGVLPSILLLRRRPEDVGLLPDGARAAAPGVANTRLAPAFEDSFTLPEAIRTSAFWLLVGAQTVSNLPNASLSYQMVAYYTDQGVAAALAAGALSAFALCGAVSSVLWGFLSEHVAERTLVLLVTAMAMAGALLMMTVHEPWLVVPLGGFLGLAARGEGALLNMMVASYFGRGHYGKITGVMQPFNFVGLGAGPLVASLIFDLTHNYDLVFTSAIACYVVCIALMLVVRRPVRAIHQTTP